MKHEPEKIKFDDLVSHLNSLEKNKSNQGKRDLKELHRIIDGLYEQCESEDDKQEYTKKVKNLLVYDVLFPKLLEENVYHKSESNAQIQKSILQEEKNKMTNDEIKELEELIDNVIMSSKEQPEFLEMKKEELKRQTVYIEHIKDKIYEFIYPINEIEKANLYMLILFTLAGVSTIIVNNTRVSNNITDIFWGFFMGGVIFCGHKWFKFMKIRNQNKLYKATPYPLIDILYAAGVPMDNLQQSDCLKHYDIKENSFLLKRIIEERKKQ